MSCIFFIIKFLGFNPQHRKTQGLNRGRNPRQNIPEGNKRGNEATHGQKWVHYQIIKNKNRYLCENFKN